MITVWTEKEVSSRVTKNIMIDFLRFKMDPGTFPESTVFLMPKRTSLY